MNIPLHQTTPFSPTHHSNSKTHLKTPIMCALWPRKRKRNAFGKNTKLILESACIIASKMGFLPEPLELILREQFGSGSGSGSGNGFGFGWGGGSFDGWKRKRGQKLGVLILVLACGVGFWLVLNEGFYFGGLGLILFGVSMNGWRTRAKDWICGFCCCAVLVGLLLKKEDLRAFWTQCMKKNATRRRRKVKAF